MDATFSPSGFKSATFWSKFHADRRGSPFEWYATWPELRALVERALPLGADEPPRLLIPGCGNSTLSEDLYDAGYVRTTSVDFDPAVVSAMAAKTQRSCPLLEWVVGDVAALDASRFGTGAFGGVVDKGLLDALLPEEADTAAGAARATADAYLSAVARVLAPGTGVLAIVTLLQGHVLRHWVAHAAAHAAAWDACRIYPISQGGGGRPSPLCPYFVALTRSSVPWAEVVDSAVRGTVAPTLAVHLGSLPGVMGPQGDGSTPPTIFAVHADAEGAPLGGFDSLAAAVEEQQWAYGVQFALAQVGDAYLSLHLWGGSGGGAGIVAVSPLGARPESLGLPAGAAPLYAVTVLDVKPPPGRGAVSAAVLLVPVGREHEWAFATREGAAGLAASARVDRLLVVTLGSGAAAAARFARMTPKDVQAELSPAVLTMVPAECRGSIPFLAVSEHLGRRVIVAEGASPVSGAWAVEDVDEFGGAGGGGALRRLVFASNRAALQTEVRCVGGAVTHSGALCFPYHRVLVRALTALLAPPPAPAAARVPVLVVGLGGGALPSHLAAAFPWLAVTAVELDSAVVDIAAQYFALAPANVSGAAPPPIPAAGLDAEAEARASAAWTATLADVAAQPLPGRVRVLVGDGLRVLALLGHAACSPAARPAAVVLDVNAGATELRTGLSFPPPAFVTRAALAAMRDAVSQPAGVPQGVAMLNLGARSAAMHAAVLAAVGSAFGGACAVLERDESEEEESGGADLNSVVVAGGDLLCHRNAAAGAPTVLKGCRWC